MFSNKVFFKWPFLTVSFWPFLDHCAVWSCQREFRTEVYLITLGWNILVWQRISFWEFRFRDVSERFYEIWVFWVWFMRNCIFSDRRNSELSSNNTNRIMFFTETTFYFLAFRKFFFLARRFKLFLNSGHLYSHAVYRSKLTCSWRNGPCRDHFLFLPEVFRIFIYSHEKFD